ncbi:hypothetical protein E2C01_094539 [Portunus trituberculatus]|uniref:Uncharacterized protein n=1 Tax=Portunus trituberculatus TaxID=210409 RepID=A0A5B7JXG3_PORTR|nr:hypothetical protein [Portunus trituberculatus]
MERLHLSSGRHQDVLPAGEAWLRTHPPNGDNISGRQREVKYLYSDRAMKRQGQYVKERRFKVPDSDSVRQCGGRWECLTLLLRKEVRVTGI